MLVSNCNCSFQKQIKNPANQDSSRRAKYLTHISSLTKIYNLTCKSKNILYRRNIQYWFSSSHLIFSTYSWSYTKNYVNIWEFLFHKFILKSLGLYKTWIEGQTVIKRPKRTWNHTHIIFAVGMTFLASTFLNIDHFHVGDHSSFARRRLPHGSKGGYIATSPFADEVVEIPCLSHRSDNPHSFSYKFAWRQKHAA